MLYTHFMFILHLVCMRSGKRLRVELVHPYTNTLIYMRGLSHNFICVCSVKHRLSIKMRTPTDISVQTDVYFFCVILYVIVSRRVYTIRRRGLKE